MIRAMIEARLGGRIEQDFAPTGLICRLHLPLDEEPGNLKPPSDLAIAGEDGART